MQILLRGMNQESVIADIEERAHRARVSMAAVCREAGINPTTVSRWKRSERNPNPMGATLQSIGKLYAALDKLERQAARRSRRTAVAA